MVYELGWNWNDFDHLAQGLLAGHLLECGCQLTGGYFMHPGDKYRNMSFEHLLDLSLPFAEVGFDGKVCVAKAEGSGGIINFSTCAEQLLYEVGDTGAYITPDVVLDLRDVSFSSLSVDKVLCTGAKPSDHLIPNKLLQLVPKDYGWKGWGEISYGGHGCVERAKTSEFLVRSWMEEAFPGVHKHIASYIIGFNSLKATNRDQKTSSGRDIEDIRLRMDGLFEVKEQAIHFIREFTALYTNGPAGGGGISTGYKKEIILEKNLVSRESVFWCTRANHSKAMDSWTKEYSKPTPSPTFHEPIRLKHLQGDCSLPSMEIDLAPAPSGQKIPLYNVAHSRAGDKGNNLNLSIIPHFLPDIERLKVVITPDWVKKVVSALLDASSFADQDDSNVQKGEDLINKNVQVKIYEAKGIHSLNIVINNILDGGVNCSRRIDRHGKTISDLILCQEIVLPPPP